MARPAATVYFVLMLTSVRATELTADWPTMEVGALKEATAASRPSMAKSERREIPSKPLAAIGTRRVKPRTDYPGCTAS